MPAAYEIADAMKYAVAYEGFILFHIRQNAEYFTMTSGHYFISEGYFTFILERSKTLSFNTAKENTK